MQLPPGTPELFGVFGFSDGRLFVVGKKATILEYDGTSWTRHMVLPASWDTSPSSQTHCFDVWGTSSSHVFVVGGDGPSGSSGGILRYDGTTWHDEDSGVAVALNSVWGTSATDVFAAGGVALLRRDSPTWQDVNQGAVPGGKYALWGSAPDRMFVSNGAQVFRYDGSTWTLLGPTRPSWSVWGLWGVGDDVFAVGSVILDHDATHWTAHRRIGSASLAAVWGTALDNIYAVGAEGTLLHFTGVTWAELPQPGSGVVAQFNDLWGTAWNDLYVANNGAPQLLHFNGSTWEARCSGLLDEGKAVWGVSPSEVYVGGLARNSFFGGIIRYTGSSCIEEVGDNDEHGVITDLWGTSNGHVYAAALSLTLLHRTSTWSLVSSFPPSQDDWALSGVWMAADHSAGAAVGEDGGAWIYDGSWTYYQPTTRPIHGVWGAAGNDIYAVGSGGLVLHWDGTSWQTLTDLPVTCDLLSVWGRSATEIFVGGQGGTVMYYDGVQWIPLRSGTTEDVRGILGEGRSVYFVTKSRVEQLVTLGTL